MEIITSNSVLQRFLLSKRKDGSSIGFVPTMGALHQGHISLIEASKQKCNITICSIYINPTQFNQQNDLETYPKSTEKDIQMLRSVHCDVCFFPTTEDVYPEGIDKLLELDLDGLELKMEGEHRPGHFKGVVTVVHNFFQLIKPDVAFFGEKDYQQLAIIKKMNEKLHLGIDIIGCPIVRDVDGLAMSSRNERLSVKERKVVPFIYSILTNAVRLAKNNEEKIKWVEEQIKLQPLIRLDYFEIASENTLSLAQNGDKCRAFIAVFIGDIRLIDNLALNN